MKKELNDLTIKEYYNFNDLINEEVPDIVSILELFGYDVDNMTAVEFNKVQNDIVNMKLDVKNIKLYYNINGRWFKSLLNIKKMKAGQFIDFQSYASNNKFEEFLSVFLVPIKRNYIFFKKYYNYSEGYNVLEVQDYLLNNMTIQDANSLKVFFLKISTNLLKVTRDFLIKKNLMMKKKMLKKSKKMLID